MRFLNRASGEHSQHLNQETSPFRLRETNLPRLCKHNEKTGMHPHRREDGGFRRDSRFPDFQTADPSKHLQAFLLVRTNDKELVELRDLEDFPNLGIDVA